jgi:hypothetical protein
MPVMRCPPRHERGHGRENPCLWRLSCNRGACLAHKSPLTNRIRRHFARIKAAGIGFGPIMVTAANWAANRLRDAQETFGERSGDLKPMSGTFRTRKSGHFENESPDISQAKVRTRRGRRPGRSCRPPFHFRLRHECANGAPFPPRSPARRCDRPAGRSARRD